MERQELSRIKLPSNIDYVALDGQLLLYEEQRDKSVYLGRIESSKDKVAIIPWKDAYAIFPIGKPQIFTLRNTNA